MINWDKPEVQEVPSYYPGPNEAEELEYCHQMEKATQEAEDCEHPREYLDEDGSCGLCGAYP